jgi:hypothetical protein
MEHEGWRSIASDLGIQAIAPFDLTIGGTRATFTVLLPQFGGRKGMIVDPVWSMIEPYADALAKEGYGYSCVSMEGSTPRDLQGILADWGWNGSTREKPDCL